MLWGLRTFSKGEVERKIYIYKKKLTLNIHLWGRMVHDVSAEGGVIRGKDRAYRAQKTY